MGKKGKQKQKEDRKFQTENEKRKTLYMKSG